MMKIIIGGLIGAILGGITGYFGKCASGMCPLTSNPWTGAIFGSIMGMLIASSFGRQP